MKRNIRKKLTAAICVIAIVVGMTAAGMAGSIFDTLKNGAMTAWNGVKTWGQAVADTCDYLFTDDDFDTAYTSTQKMANRTKNSYKDAVQSGKQIKKDAEDIVEGGRKMAEGAEEFLENGTQEDVLNLLHGKGVESEGAKKALETIREGYEQADNDLILDALTLCPGGAGVAYGAKILKTGAEYAVGYIDQDTARERTMDAAIDLAVGTAGGAVGDMIDGVVPAILEAGGEKLLKEGLKEAGRELLLDGAE